MPSRQTALLQSGKLDRSALGRAVMAVGIGGAALAALCCFTPFLVAGVLTAIGLGFLLNEAILVGLLVLSAGIAVLGYYLLHRAGPLRTRGERDAGH